MNDPIATLVFQAGRGEVDTVLVDGRVLKHRGEPLGIDLDRARTLAENSRDHLRTAIGGSPDHREVTSKGKAFWLEAR
ncbi:hypothetical protein [Streptomyces sp. GESEQ-4]|uniref:hypothetical protein n=1 Tax=Streptomyces sp. GESEQ-4 TaxID=2812655 RepID=UPI001B322D53|nr:hypothetical protein [Streptomyces sp. GESEQ-4]